MALPAELTDLIQKSIPSVHRSEVYVQSCTPLGGGDINQAYRLNTSAGPFFLKFNSASRYPGMFEKEAAGLHLIASTGEVRVPKVIFHGRAGDDICLVHVNLFGEGYAGSVERIIQRF